MEWRIQLVLALAAVLVFRVASASKDCDAAEGCCADFQLEPGTEIDKGPAAVINSINDEARSLNKPPSRASNQDHQRVLITGANQGLGLETSLALARLGGYDLTMTCRDQRKCDETVKKVKDVVRAGTKLECEIVDFAIMASVDELASKFSKKAKQSDKYHFDVAILNAGVLIPDERTTVDGLETSFQVNYLAQYKLLKTVISIRRSARPARPPLSVITMTSITRHVAWTPRRGSVTDIPREWGVYVDPTVTRITCSQFIAYARSKWATAALTVILNKDRQQLNVHAVAVNPGYMSTNMARTGADENCIRKFLRDCLSNTAAEAAKNVVYTVQHIDEFGPNQYRDEATTRTLKGNVVDPANLDKLRTLTAKLLP